MGVNSRFLGDVRGLTGCWLETVGMGPNAFAFMAQNNIINENIEAFLRISFKEFKYSRLNSIRYEYILTI